MYAQVGPFPGTSIPLISAYQQSVQVPAGNNPTLMNIVVDAPATGQEMIDVLTGDPGVVISLILPNGTEVTASNAAANGFVFSTYAIDGTADSTDNLLPFVTGGTLTFPDRHSFHGKPNCITGRLVRKGPL